MPNLLERIQEFATRNLPAPPAPPIAKAAPPAAIPTDVVAAKPTESAKPKPAPVVAMAVDTGLSLFLANVRATVGGAYCSPPKPALYSKPRCTDCSGNVAYAFYKATGRRIPGDGGSHEQYNQAGRFLKRGATPEPWLPGDLLFYDTMGVRRAGNRASHVAVYMGDGKAISAMNPNQGIIEHDTNTKYWNTRFLNAKRLWEVTTPDPDPDPDPGTGPKPVTAAAAPITPPASVPIAFTTPFRSIPPVSEATWARILTDAQSPMAPEAAAIYRACGPLVTVAGAQSYKESQYGKAAAAANNPLGLMELDGSTLKRYATWADAFTDWWKRMTDSAYKPGTPGVYMPRDISFEQFIVIYVGGPRCWSTRGAECGNGESWVPGGGPGASSINLYLYQTKARINRYLGHYEPDPLWPDFEEPGGPTPEPAAYTAHRIEGTTERLYLPKDMGFKIQLTPAWRTCNRSGRHLSPTGIRQHETGNTRPGTGAQMHANWQENGTQGHPDGCVAVHFYVDGGVVIQTLPVNEQGIHSGDAGNQTQIAIETCVNSDGNWAKTYRNTVALEAGLHNIFGFDPDDDMWMHRATEGCPPNLRKVWGQFERDVQNALDAILAAF